MAVEGEIRGSSVASYLSFGSRGVYASRATAVVMSYDDVGTSSSGTVPVACEGRKTNGPTTSLLSVEVDRKLQTFEPGGPCGPPGSFTAVPRQRTTPTFGRRVASVLLANKDFSQLSPLL